MVMRENVRSSILRLKTSDEKSSLETVGVGLASVRDRGRPNHLNSSRGGGNGGGGWNQRRMEDRQAEEDRSKLVCTYCGRKKHTRETCCKLVGFPDWWESKHKAPPPLPRHQPWNREGHAAAAVGEEGGAPIPSLPSRAAVRPHKLEATSANNRSVKERPKQGSPSSPEASLSPPTDRSEARKEEAEGGKGGLGFDVFKPLSPNFVNIANPTPALFNHSNKSHSSRKFQKLPHSSNSFTIECTNSFQALANFGTAYAVSKNCTKNNKWIFDCGATDTMTYDESDITKPHKPHLSHIQTASGEITTVKQAGTVKISPTLELSNCLHVPSLSHKLISISHVTRELNCTLLMQSNFCLLQDIRTGEIIGRGTESDGLYYVDEIAHKGTAMLTHGSADREAWLLAPTFRTSFPGLFKNVVSYYYSKISYVL